MIYNENELEKECIKNAVALITGAIKTAPKSRGLNSLKTLVVTDEDKNKIAKEMLKNEKNAFQRDSKNVQQADAVILIGVKKSIVGLDCGWCHYKDCKDNQQHNGLCIFNLVDLGIALGSAVSSASLLKADNRIMYTIGYTVKDMNIFEKEYNIIMGIPLKYSHKNIFFDRK